MTNSSCSHYNVHTIEKDHIMNISIRIIAKNSLDENRTSGGDLFVVHAISASGNVAGHVQDNFDGTYDAHVSVLRHGSYFVRVQLAIVVSPLIFRCYEKLREECRPIYYLKMQDLKALTFCTWEEILSTTGEHFNIDFSSNVSQGPCIKKPFCSAGQFSKMSGRWNTLSNCSCSCFCGKAEMLQKPFKLWKAQYFEPLSCRLKAYRAKNIKSCRPIHHGLALAGDSVTKKAFLLAGRQLGLKLSAYDMYDIFKFKKNSHPLSLALSSGKHSVFALGSGRHDLLENSVREYVDTFNQTVIPLLQMAVSKGSKVIWLLTSAPRARVPLGAESNVAQQLKSRKAEMKLPIADWNKIAGASCFNGEIHSSLKKKLMCRGSRDACNTWYQRWDRILELNYLLRRILTPLGIDVLDTHSITDTGDWEWHDDNVHHHYGRSGLSTIVFQALLNVACQ